MDSPTWVWSIYLKTESVLGPEYRKGASSTRGIPPGNCATPGIPWLACDLYLHLLKKVDRAPPPQTLERCNNSSSRNRCHTTGSHMQSTLHRVGSPRTNRISDAAGRGRGSRGALLQMFSSIYYMTLSLEMLRTTIGTCTLKLRALAVCCWSAHRHQHPPVQVLNCNGQQERSFVRMLTTAIVLQEVVISAAGVVVVLLVVVVVAAAAAVEVVLPRMSDSSNSSCSRGGGGQQWHWQNQFCSMRSTGSGGGGQFVAYALARWQELTFATAATMRCAFINTCVSVWPLPWQLLRLLVLQRNSTLGIQIAK